MPNLLLKEKNKPIKKIPLNMDGLKKTPFKVGRLPKNNLVLTDSKISREHFQITFADKRFLIEDLKSSNGTFVNNQRVQKKFLQEGDEIRVGENILTFHENELSPGEVEKAQEIIRPLKDFQIDAPSYDKKRDQYFFILYQLGKTLISAPNLNELLEAAMSLIFQVINAERGILFLLNEKGCLTPKVVKHSQVGRIVEEELKFSSTITQKVIEERVSLITSDAKYDPRLRTGESIVQYNIRSALCVPIWEGKEIFGVIYLDHLLENHTFTEDNLELLTAVANLIALGIRQEKLREGNKKDAVLRSNLERYLSPDVVTLILQRSRELEGVTLEIQEKEVTILFSDIKDFASLAERLKPAEVASLLNGYFNRMTSVIFKYHGSINKFIGDAIMALFGAPLSQENDAQMAVQAALEMLRELQFYNENIDERKRFSIRLGINTGQVVAGNIGSQSQMEYTVIGDAVNIASRLESIAKPNQILIGENTYERIRGQFKVQALGSVPLRGKKIKIGVYEVLQ
ncbi:MAG: FHA domain-containing protein [Deltaproteobacteria bacterium]|nr:MAG: FHA domain-containing protein [Deltaproteobacteria bacterium]